MFLAISNEMVQIVMMVCYLIEKVTKWKNKKGGSHLKWYRINIKCQQAHLPSGGWLELILNSQRSASTSSIDGQILKSFSGNMRLRWRK